MSESTGRCVRIRAPAKLNLGLEVLGRRSDGYHELATIFITVSLCDELAIAERPWLQVECDDPEIETDANLALRALQALQRHAGGQTGARVQLRKSIPMAAGLGGASSDAAATLVAARGLWRLPTDDDELGLVASGIGSDVPFFVRGGCAAGTGRGELLEPLPLPTDVHFVVVVPAISIPGKTASLYAALQPSDLSDGSRVTAQSARLRARLELDQALLGNAFTRALYERVPDLASLPDIMRKAGASSIAISGAGPAHYAATNDPDAAAGIATRLKDSLGHRSSVFLVAPVPERAN